MGAGERPRSLGHPSTVYPPSPPSSALHRGWRRREVPPEPRERAGWGWARGWRGRPARMRNGCTRKRLSALATGWRTSLESQLSGPFRSFSPIHPCPLRLPSVLVLFPWIPLSCVSLSAAAAPEMGIRSFCMGSKSCPFSQSILPSPSFQETKHLLRD